MVVKKNSLFNILLLNKEIDEKGKHIIIFPPDLPIIVREYNFRFEFPVKPNFHDYLEIIYILKNEVTLKCGKKDYDVKKGDILIVGKNEIHNCFQHEDESVEFISVKFLAEMIYSFGGYDMDFEYLRPFYSRSYNFNKLISFNSINNQNILEKIYFIKNTIEEKKKHYRIKAKNVLAEILLEIVEYYDELPIELLDEHSKYLKELNRLKNVFELLNNEYGQKISLSRAADVAFLNECYFSKFFKRVTGFTYSNYLQRIRIEKAKELLINEDFSIARIAFLTGFNTLNFFNKTFKKFTKLTPTEYRMKTRKKEI